MRRRTATLAVFAMVATGVAVLVDSPGSNAGTSVPQRIAAGTLRPASLPVDQGVKRMPFPTRGDNDRPGSAASASATQLESNSADTSPGITVKSVGCADRAQGSGVRVNQDCTFRRQSETAIDADPNDPTNLVAGMNDSIIGFNQTSIDFSVDGGQHWGAVSTAPFRYRLNAPEDLGPTPNDPNRHTIRGGSGTLHSYDACSDPYLTFDSRGRAFYTCVTFDIASNAAMAFVVPSPPGAKGSYFDQVPAPFGITSPYTGREHIVSEDNSAAASYDAPKVAADAFVGSPNRDNVYFTWTVFDFSCGPHHDAYCESPIWGSMSTDHGFTWSTPEKISGTNPSICTLGNAFNPNRSAAACNLDGHSDLIVRPNGELAVTFISQNTPNQNPEILSLRCKPSGDSVAGTAHLNCGGPTKVSDYVLGPSCDFGRGPEQCIPGAYIRAPFETSQRIGVDPSNGDLYNTFYDYRYGEFDVFVTRSTDAGKTWSAPQLVNPDRGTDHYFSAIDVAGHDSQRVAISYFRTGRVPGEDNPPPGGFGPNVAHQMSDYVLSGGKGLNTPFAFEVVSPKFPPPDGIQAGFNGDYTDVVIDANGIAHPIWADTRNQVPNPGFNKVHVDEDVFTVSRPIPGG